MKIGRLNIKSRNLGFLLGLAVAGALILAGCPSIFDPPAQGGGYGKVGVELGVDAERTIRPDLSLIDGDYDVNHRKYKAYKDALGANEVPLTMDGKYAVLPYGTYWLSVDIYSYDVSEVTNPDPAKKVASGMTRESFLLQQATPMVTVKIYLTPARVLGASGTFKFDFSWNTGTAPAGYFDNAEFVMTLEELRGNEFVPYVPVPPIPAFTWPTTANGGGSYDTGVIGVNNGANGWELPQGSYLFTFQLYLDDGAGYWGVTEAVHIESGLTTVFKPAAILHTDVVGIDEENAYKIFEEGLVSWVGRNPSPLATPSNSDFIRTTTPRTVSLYFLGVQIPADTSGIKTFPLTAKGGWAPVTGTENPNPLASANLDTAPVKVDFRFRGSTGTAYSVTLQPVAEYTVRKFTPSQEATGLPGVTGDLTFPAGLIFSGSGYSAPVDGVATRRYLGKVDQNTDLTLTRTSNVDLRIDGILQDTGTAPVVISNPVSKAYTINLHHQLTDQIDKAMARIPNAIISTGTADTDGWVRRARLTSVITTPVYDSVNSDPANNLIYDLYYVHERLGGTTGSPVSFPIEFHQGWSRKAGSAFTVDGENQASIFVEFVTTDEWEKSPKVVQLRLNPVAEFKATYDSSALPAFTDHPKREMLFKGVVDGTGTLYGGTGTDLPFGFNSSGLPAAGTSKVFMFSILASNKLPAEVGITGTLVEAKYGTSTLPNTSGTQFVYGTDNYILGTDYIFSRVYDFIGYKSDFEQRKAVRRTLSTGTRLDEWVQSSEQPWLPKNTKYISNTGTDPDASRIFYVHNSLVPNTGTKSGTYGIPGTYLTSPYRFNTGSSTSEWNIFFTPTGGIEGDIPVYTINLTPVAEISVDFQSSMNATDRDWYKLTKITGTNGEWNGVDSTATLSVAQKETYLGIITTGTGYITVSNTAQITIVKDTATGTVETPGGTGPFTGTFSESARYTVRVYPDIDTQKARANKFLTDELAKIRQEHLTTGTLAVLPVVPDTGTKIVSVYYYGPDSARLSEALTGTSGVLLSSQWKFTESGTAPSIDYNIKFQPVGGTENGLTAWDRITLKRVVQFRAEAGEPGLSLGADIMFVNQSGTGMSILQTASAGRLARIDYLGTSANSTTGTISSVKNAISLHTGTADSAPIANSRFLDSARYVLESALDSQEYIVNYFPSKTEQEKARLEEAASKLTTWVTDARIKDFGLLAKQPAASTLVIDSGTGGTGTMVLYYLQGYSTGSLASTITTGTSPWVLNTGSSWSIPEGTGTPPVLLSSTPKKTILLQNKLKGLNKDNYTSDTPYFANFVVDLTPVARYVVEKASGAVGTIDIVASDTKWNANSLDNRDSGFLSLGSTTVTLSDNLSVITVHDITNQSNAGPPNVLEATGVFDASSLLYRILISTRN